MQETAGKWIVFEGIDGSGKSSVTAAIHEWLQMVVGHEKVIKTRELGGTPLAENIRTVAISDWDEEVDPTTEALLFYAGRVQLYRMVTEPFLKQGNWVVQDRHDMSTQAYQGAGREMSSTTKQLASVLLKDIRPTITFVLDIPYEEGMRRTGNVSGGKDRISDEGKSFYDRVRNYYLNEAAKREDVVLINARHSKNQVLTEIKSILQMRFPELVLV